MKGDYWRGLVINISIDVLLPYKRLKKTKNRC